VKPEEKARQEIDQLLKKAGFRASERERGGMVQS